MPQVFKPFETGIGAKVEYVPLAKGDGRVQPRLVVTAAALAAKNSATVNLKFTSLILSQPVSIPAGSFLALTDPITGKETIIQVKATITGVTAATAPFDFVAATASVVASHEPIAINSVGSNYLNIGARTTAEVGISIQDEVLRTFDAEFYSQGQIISGEGTFNCSGAYSQLDAGLRTVQALTVGSTDLDGITVLNLAGQQGWVYVTIASPSDAYSAGTVFRGIAYCTDLSLTVDASAITIQDLPFKLNGTLFIDPPSII